MINTNSIAPCCFQRSPSSNLRDDRHELQQHLAVTKKHICKLGVSTSDHCPNKRKAQRFLPADCRDRLPVLLSPWVRRSRKFYSSAVALKITATFPLRYQYYSEYSSTDLQRTEFVSFELSGGSLEPAQRVCLCLT